VVKKGLSKRSRVTTRLKRLVDSSICPAENVTEYEDALKQLASDEADVRQAKAEAKFFKALGDETRLRIVKLLSIREMCVCEVMVALGMTQPTTSHHLNILENAGLVASRKEGRWVFYRLDDPDLVRSMEKLKLL
jgi:DNA-binding transcriptional ArsR family regulator